MSEQFEEKLTSEDAIGQLIRLAGPPSDIEQVTEQRVRSQVQEQWKMKVAKRKHQQRVQQWSAMGLAAALCLAFFIFRNIPIAQNPGFAIEKMNGTVSVILPNQDQISYPKVGDQLPLGTQIHSDAGSRMALTTPEGLSLRINQNAQLTLIASSTLQLTQGRVYVDSNRDSAPPLLVNTSMGSVRDIGTQFEVDLSEDQLRVRVREGLILLSEQGREHKAEAGSELILSRDGSLEHNNIPVSGLSWQWILDIAPAWQLDGQSLTKFLDWVAREDGRPLVFADPSLEAEAPSIILSGSTSNFTPEQSLKAVLPTCGLNFEINEHQILILRENEDLQ